MTMKSEPDRFRVSTTEPNNSSRNQVETTSIFAVYEPKVSTVSTSGSGIQTSVAQAHAYTRTCESPDVGKGRTGRNLETLETGRVPSPTRCYVCRKPSIEVNRFAMRPDPNGVDRLVHMGCLRQWHTWIRSVCFVCGETDLPDDPIG